MELSKQAHRGEQVISELKVAMGNISDSIFRISRVRNLLAMKLSFAQDALNKRLELDNEIDELLILLSNELQE